jgi:hypothetical protein
MKRITSLISAALVFAALAFALTQPARTVKAADINDRCNDCTAKNAQQFDQCQAVHGINYQRCYDDYNEGVVHCFAHFCEQ